MTGGNSPGYIDTLLVKTTGRAVVPTISERLAALYEQITPEALETMQKNADTLTDPELLGKLEAASKPLTRAVVLTAIVDSVLRNRGKRQ